MNCVKNKSIHHNQTRSGKAESEYNNDPMEWFRVYEDDPDELNEVQDIIEQDGAENITGFRTHGGWIETFARKAFNPNNEAFEEPEGERISWKRKQCLWNT